LEALETVLLVPNNDGVKAGMPERKDVAEKLCALRSTLEVVLSYETEVDLEDAKSTRRIYDMIG
jgi:hypothetical protein